MKKTVYLSLGSNVGDRLGHLQDGIARLTTIGRIIGVSALYETEPVDEPNQPWFLNCAMSLETELMPRQMLSAIQAIEHELGRSRKKGRPKGPRTLDIDILLFANSIIDTASLTVPHPRLHQRRFVLEPLAEIVPDVRHPILKQTIRELRDALPANAGAVRRLSAPDWSPQAIKTIRE
jgi:2-amino-4-hydroxy-6-hydroxymethyldihydropteridine diphosphokinase